MAVGAVGLKQRGRGLHRLQQLFVDLSRGAAHLSAGGADAERRRRGRGGVGVADHRGLEAEIGGNRLVEAVLALQQLLDPAQEGARLGALDDAVVVGRGQRHHFADAELLDPFRRGVPPLRRVGDRAGGDDRALAAEQTRHRGHRPDPARIGEGDVRPLEVVGAELVLARLCDQLFVVGVEAGEVEPVGALDRRHHQGVGAVLFLDVDGDPEVDRAAIDRERLALALLEDPDHDREVFGRLDDRPGDEVGEGNLQPPVFEHQVDRLAFRIQRVNRNRPERGSRRHSPALIHRISQHRRSPTQLLGLTSARGDRAIAFPVRRSDHILFGHLRPGTGTTQRSKVDAGGFSHPPRNGRRPDIGSAITAIRT